jgi:hypothetical protein
VTCRYIVAQFGDLNRGEVMNVAVLTWDLPPGSNASPDLKPASDAPVYLHLLKDWSRVFRAFPKWGGEAIKEIVSERLRAIRTFGEYEAAIEGTGPYTPFHFTGPRASTETAAECAVDVAKFFLVEPEP